MTAGKAQIDRLLKDLRNDNEKICIDAAFELARVNDAYVIDGLITALEDQKPLVRNFAVFALAEIGSPKARGPVVDLLRDPDIGVRTRAAWALSKIGDECCIGDLAMALQLSLEIDAHLCRQIIVALSDIGGTGTAESILLAFRSSIPEVRAVAARFLGYLGDNRIKERLSELLQHENDVSVRAELHEALESLGKE